MGSRQGWLTRQVVRRTPDIGNTDMNPGQPCTRCRLGLRFCVLFAVWLGGMAVAFQLLRPYLLFLYMEPLSTAAAWTLRQLGVPAHSSGPLLPVGICQLRVNEVVYWITFECTGIFALFLCLASVLAFPATLAAKSLGVALVAPAFVLYSIARLAIMGLVAWYAPERIALFHLYIMVIVNTGFVLLLWLYWIRAIVARNAVGV